MNLPLPATLNHGTSTYEVLKLQGVDGSPKQFGKYLVLKVWVKLIDSMERKRNRDRDRVELIAINQNTGDAFLLMPMGLGRGSNHVTWTEKRISAYALGKARYAHELMDVFGKDDLA